jgi:phenylpropionate dioxygenase-like ring-hydroxylating dioxygenase large terminal subunit
MSNLSAETKSVLDLLGAIRGQPYRDVHALPPAFYNGVEFSNLERERVFRTQWVCVGHAGEVREPGDYFTTELIDEPLLVVRGDDREVRVLSNVCRHRANLVATGRGNRGTFTCSYHAWTYARDGALLRAPHMDDADGFDLATCRLPEFATELWQGFIFVNLHGGAEPLAPQLSELMPHIANYHQEARHLVYDTEEVWRTNWKCLAENFMESYHLSVTHPRTIHPYLPTRLAEGLPGGEGFSAYKGHHSPAASPRGVYHPDLTATERRCSVLFCVYPALVVSYAPDITMYMCLRPREADEVAIRWGLAAHAADLSADEVQGYVDWCNELNGEDRERLEAVQTGLKSRYYVPGPLASSDLEGTVWDLYQFVARRIGSRSH